MGHLRVVEGESEGGGDESADEAAGVVDEEGHFGGVDVLGGEHQVASVLAVGGVEHEDGFAAFFVGGTLGTSL